MSDTIHPIEMGYIRAVVGVKGWVKVKTNTEYVDSLLDYPTWLLAQDTDWQEYTLESGKVTVDGLQVKFQGIDDRSVADSLRGLTIAIPREEFPQTEADEFYWTDLIHLIVENECGVNLGEVSGLMETGAHDVLVIRNDTGELLIPFVSHYVKTVDIDNKKIIVDWELDY